MERREKKLGVLTPRNEGVGPRGVPGRSVAALELEAEAWQTERGKLRRKVTYGHKQMLNLLYNNQLLLERASAACRIQLRMERRKKKFWGSC